MSKSKPQVQLFVGDRVSWKSQAGGFWKEKLGTVIEVVPPHITATMLRTGARARAHESYVVEVTFEPKRSTSAIKSMRTKKPERYQPNVSALKRVRKSAPPLLLNLFGPGAKDATSSRPHPTGVTDPEHRHVFDDADPIASVTKMTYTDQHDVQRTAELRHDGHGVVTVTEEEIDEVARKTLAAGEPVGSAIRGTQVVNGDDEDEMLHHAQGN